MVKSESKTQGLSEPYSSLSIHWDARYGSTNVLWNVEQGTGASWKTECLVIMTLIPWPSGTVASLYLTWDTHKKMKLQQLLTKYCNLSLESQIRINCHHSNKKYLREGWRSVMWQ